MTNSVIDWRKGLDAHYPTIHDFPDAQTVRIMLRNIDEWIKSDDGVVADLQEHPETLKDWVAGNAEERDQLLAIKVELEDWLAKRQLTR